MPAFTIIGSAGHAWISASRAVSGWARPRPLVPYLDLALSRECVTLSASIPFAPGPVGSSPSRGALITQA
jgi:hypothetical protein